MGSQVVNALLTQMDKLKSSPNVIILTTSNITAAIGKPIFILKLECRAAILKPCTVTGSSFGAFARYGRPLGNSLAWGFLIPLLLLSSSDKCNLTLYTAEYQPPFFLSFHMLNFIYYLQHSKPLWCPYTPLLDCRYRICWSSRYQSLRRSSNTSSSLWNSKVVLAGTCAKGNPIEFSGDTLPVNSLQEYFFLNLRHCFPFSRGWCWFIGNWVLLLTNTGIM